MGFYDLSDEERQVLKNEIVDTVLNDFRQNTYDNVLPYFVSDDTHTRKATYQAVGKLYFEHTSMRGQFIAWLNALLKHEQLRRHCAVLAVLDPVPLHGAAAVRHIRNGHIAAGCVLLCRNRRKGVSGFGGQRCVSGVSPSGGTGEFPDFRIKERNDCYAVRHDQSHPHPLFLPGVFR